MKRSISITLLTFVTILFSGCAAMERNENVHSAGDTEELGISHIYDGYEELQGKGFSGFTMPEKIEKQDISEAYTFIRSEAKKRDYKAESELSFKALFGNDYNEKFVRSSEHPIWYAPDRMLYEYVDDKGGYASYSLMAFGGFIGGWEKLNSFQSSQKVFSTENTSQQITLGNSTVTVGEVADYANEILHQLSPLYNVELFPMYVNETTYLETGAKAAEVVCAGKYKGIPMEDDSLFSKTEQRNGYSVMTSYNAARIKMIFDSPGHITVLNTASFPNWEFEETKLDKLISLKDAVAILDKEIAPNSHYEIEEVRLMYCCKVTGVVQTNDEDENSRNRADYGEQEPERFVPTWCFRWHSYTDKARLTHAIKVDAVTGEITIDI